MKPFTVERREQATRARQNARGQLKSLLKCMPAVWKSGRAMAYHFARRLSPTKPELSMSKEQRATKNTKKPKKDAATPKAAGSDRPTPPVTSVAPKGKLAKKPA
jgi:hypothetical protein